MIRPAAPSDAPAICSIYNHYIEHSVITFEETLLTEADIAERISTYSSTHAYIVFEEGGEVVGYAYASPWRARHAYRFSTETSIYLKPGHEGKGIGEKLYVYLIEELRKKGFHSIIGCLTLPNSASERLHEKLGFKKIAHFHEAGYKFDKWLDVGFWELLV